MKRGSVKKAQSTLITVWVPLDVASALDAAVASEDTDRSKFTRRALREKLGKLGITINEEEAA